MWMELIDVCDSIQQTLVILILFIKHVKPMIDWNLNVIKPSNQYKIGTCLYHSAFVLLNIHLQSENSVKVYESTIEEASSFLYWFGGFNNLSSRAILKRNIDFFIVKIWWTVKI